MTKTNLKPESEVEGDIVEDAAMTFSSHLWRNNSGAFTQGKHHVRFGLGNKSKKHNDEMKSSDEIGITPVLITPDMVGLTLGVFTSIEVKKEGWKFTGTEDETAQKTWIDLVKLRGGIAGFAQSVDDYRKIINDYISSLRNRSN